MRWRVDIVGHFEVSMRVEVDTTRCDMSGEADQGLCDCRDLAFMSFRSGRGADTRSKMSLVASSSI